MATKINGKYYAGLVVVGGRKSYEPQLPDVRHDNRFGRMDCKYCYTDDVQTVSSYEDIAPWGPQVQALCSNCGAGLTPCAPYEVGSK